MNKIFLYTFIFLIAGIATASAMTVSFTTPSAGSTVTGTAQAVTVAFTLGASENVSIANLYWQNGTEKLLRIATNASANMTSPITFSINTATLFVDTRTGTLNITLTNSSGIGENSTMATLSVESDNTVPLATRVELNPTTGARGDPISSRCYGSDAIDTSVVYAQTLARAGNPVNTTRTGDSVTWEGTLFLDLANDYRVYCTVSDNAPLNASTYTEFTVGSEDDGARVITTQKKAEAVQAKTNNLVFLWIGLGVLVIIVIIAVIVMTTKPNKRRRR